MNEHSMAGKTCLVTGATDGIGKEAAIGLARLGATVIVLGRNREKGEAVVREIVERTGNSNVELLVCDLSSQRSIREAVAELKKKHVKLNVLINQAGLYVDSRQLTEDGVELMFAVNHLAYFLLTNLVLDLLEAGAPSRVVIGTGGIEALGKIAFDDLSYAKKWKPFAALSQSKLANLLFAYELHRRAHARGISVTAFHPGGVKTQLASGQKGFMGFMMRTVRLFGSTPEQAGKIPVHLATSPELEGVSGQYFNMMKPGTSSARSRDEALAARLWEESAKLTGLATAS